MPEDEEITMTTSFGYNHYHQTKIGKRLFLEHDQPFKGTFRGDSYPLKPDIDPKKYDVKKILGMLKTGKHGHMYFDAGKLGKRRVVANNGKFKQYVIADTHDTDFPEWYWEKAICTDCIPKGDVVTEDERRAVKKKGFGKYKTMKIG